MVNGDIFCAWYRIEYHNADSEEASADGWVVCAPSQIQSLEDARGMVSRARDNGSSSRYRIVRIEHHERVVVEA